MSENPRKNSFGILPSFVMDDENLEEGAKVLYARISMLSDEGRCWATNEYFADKQKVTPRCIQKWLKDLVDSDYIEIDCERIPGKGTERNIWLKIDFKKMFTKRTTVHPPTNYSSPPGCTPVRVIYKEDKEQKNNNNEQSVVVSSILKNRTDLSDEDKKSLSQFSEERLRLALEFSKIHPPKETLVQLMMWHCGKEVPPIPDPKRAKSPPNENKALACKYAELFHSKTFVMNLLNKYVELTPRAQGEPVCIDYEQVGFKDLLEKSLSKCGFVLKTQNKE